MNNKYLRKSFQYLILLSWSFSIAVAAKGKFPLPAELQHDVDFWVRVYTEIDTKSGFIHDSRNLAVVYQTIKLTGNPRRDRKRIKEVKAKYAAILRSLAAGKRTGLSADEARVLSLWDEKVGNRRLREATGDLRFQLGQSDRFLEGLVRAGEWLPYIRETLAARQLPEELAALPHVESSFNPEAYSSVGAAGIWQFTRSTGRRFMRIDYVVDERMDPYKATVAAAQLLEHNYNVTGSWPLAVTAYNHGVAGMRRAAAKLGSKDIATLVRNYKGRTFGFASRNFYVAFLAAHRVSSDPATYFPPYRSADPVDYVTVSVPEYISMDAFTRAFKIKPAALKHHNRSLMSPVWGGSKHIPKGFTMRLPRRLLNQDAGQLLAAIPASQRFAEQTPDLFHKVARGDTVSAIASRYGHSIREIAALNGLNSRHFIRVGQQLRLPVKGTARPAAEPVVVAQKAVVTPETAPVQVKKAVLTAEKPAEVDDRGENIQLAANASTPDASEGDEGFDLATEGAPPAKDSELVEEGLDAEVGETAATQFAQAGADEEQAALAVAGASPVSLADPSDYAIAKDHTIEVQASETLGHYAEWLGLRASQLRRINGLTYGRPLVIGRRLKLDFSRVGVEEFLQQRIAYQKSLQEAFFSNYQISSTSTHVVSRGESLWELSQRNYKVPVWLLRQYNPDLDINNVRPGTVIVIPELIKT